MQNNMSKEITSTKGTILILDNFKTCIFLGKDNEGFDHSIVKTKDREELFDALVCLIAQEVESSGEETQMKYELIMSSIFTALSLAVPELYNLEDYSKIITKVREKGQKTAS